LTFTQAYNAMASDIAIEVNSANTDFMSFTSILQNATAYYGSISGVVAAEESMNLTMYQQSYQASAQIIQVAKQVFDTIIGLGRN